MDNMEMVEAMQDMFITYLKPIQEKIEILGLQNKVIQNKLDNMDLRLASLEYQVKNGFNRMDQDSVPCISGGKLKKVFPGAISRHCPWR